VQTLPVRVIAESMGSSIAHGSKVRSGLLVPHDGIGRRFSQLFEQGSRIGDVVAEPRTRGWLFR